MFHPIKEGKSRLNIQIRKNLKTTPLYLLDWIACMTTKGKPNTELIHFCPYSTLHRAGSV